MLNYFKALKNSPPRRGIRSIGGFSLPEAMVSVAIIGVTALGVSQLIVHNTKSNRVIDETSACKNHLNSIVNRFQDMAVRPDIGEFFPVVGDNSVIYSDANRIEGTQGGFSIQVSHRFPNNAAYNILDPGPPFVLRNAHLIQSYMGALSAIFNSSPNFCQNANGEIYQVTPQVGPNQLSNLFAAASRDFSLDSLQTRIRIRPYNLSTGALIPCGTLPNLIVAPRGSRSAMSTLVNTGPPATPGQRNSGSLFRTAVGGDCPRPDDRQGVSVRNERDCNAPGGAGITVGANVRNDVGFLVNLYATYQDKNQQAHGCTLESRFQLPEDGGVPAKPQVIVWENSTWGGPGGAANNRMNDYTTGPGSPTRLDVNCVPRNQNRVVIRAGYIGVGNEPGTILLCRDRSYRLSPPEASGYTVSACLSDPGNPQFPPSRPFTSPGITHNNTTQGLPRPQKTFAYSPVFGNYDIPYLDVTSYNASGGGRNATHTILGNNLWIRCDRVQLCGRAPAYTVVGGGGPSKYIEMLYTNLVSGCVMQLDVRAVDTAGNMSEIAYIDNTNPNLVPNFELLANVVQYPRCGIWCGNGRGTPVKPFGSPGWFIPPPPGPGSFTCGACPGVVDPNPW